MTECDGRRSRHRIFGLRSAGRRGRQRARPPRDATIQRPTPGDAATRAAAPALDDDVARRPIEAAAAAARRRRATRAPRPTSVRFVPRGRPACRAARAGARHAVGARRIQFHDGRRRRRAWTCEVILATAADVVRWIMAKQKLDVHRPRSATASRHVELSRALGELDLVAGVSTYGNGRYLPHSPSLVAGAGNVTAKICPGLNHAGHAVHVAVVP